jgi:prophage regulatory protein
MEEAVQHTIPESSSDRPDLVSPVFLRMHAVVRITGLGRSTIYRLIATQRFPNPVRLGPRAVAWRRTEIDLWSETRPIATH